VAAPTTSESTLLRPGLLEGVSLLLAGAPARDGNDALRVVGPAVIEACAALGARVATCAPLSDRAEVAREAALDAAVAAVAGDAGGIDMLVVDGASLFAEGGDGHAALRACMDGTWNATRATVNQAFLQAPDLGGRIVFLAPAPDAGTHADAAGAGLQNLARTLSIEWARRRITTVAIAPGTATANRELAELVAYLASPAGAYFSGCLMDLRGASATA
jgi:NAD(P)-dependent dehydrogenase (short-subunit alcohol dehydrogenase family)